MSTTTPQPIPTVRGVRPTPEEQCQNTHLLIRLRWVAGVSIVAATLLARWALGITLRTAPLLAIGLFVLAYNALLAYLCREEGRTPARTRRVAWGQILLDWLAMLGLVHFTGGITSPALIYFVIHAALSGTILMPWQTRALALLVVGIVGGMAALEAVGWLPHVAIPQFEQDAALHTDPTYILAVMFFFGTTAITLAELVSRNAQRLRQREAHIRQLYDARETFVRVATHELRAPLGAALSLMRNVEHGYAGDLTERQRAILRRVTLRLEGLQTLIDDLLTLARSREASVAHAPLEPISVRDVLAHVIERERPFAERKRIALEVEMDEAAGVVMAGEMGLRIIFGNLLNNAIKYTPEGGRVTLRYRVADGAVTVQVQDTGIGIPEQDLPRIFEEFYRASNAKKSGVVGTGIGLTTVRTLSERYNGTIRLESAEGEGTTFTVTFPLATETR